MKRRYTVMTLAHELGVLATVETGLKLVNDWTRSAILVTPIRLGRSTSVRFGSASFRISRPGALGGLLGGAALELPRMEPVRLTLHPGLFTPDMRDEMIDTFLHEVAHFIAEALAVAAGGGKKAGHGRLWRFVMRGMGRVPNRCGSAEASIQLAAKMPAPKVVARCEGCGHEIRGHRARHKYNRAIWVHRGCGGRLKGVA